MSDDAWAELADRFVDEAYPTAKGRIRTSITHHQLLEHLAAPPTSVLDVGGGAGHQSFPLARLGHHVTVLDSSPAMLGKAETRLAQEDAQVRGRVRLVQARGEDAAGALDGQQFAAVLCHGVIMYLDDPEPVITAVAECTAPGGIASVGALNANTLAVRPALERRWGDALNAFDARAERGVLGVDTRADTVEDLSELLRNHHLDPVRWYGAWLFADWVDLADADSDEVASAAAVELEASRRDPYRQFSRGFHLVARRS